jgi:hypothetical protein
LEDTPRNDSPKVEEWVENGMKTKIVYEIFGGVIKELEAIRDEARSILALANPADDAMFQASERLNAKLRSLLDELWKFE